MAPSSTAAGVGPRDALQSVDEILGELDRLAAAELAEPDFYAALLARLTPLGCSAVAVWLVGSDGAPELVWRAPTHDQKPGSEFSLTSNQAAISSALKAGQPRILDRSPEGNGASASLPSRSIIAPWSSSNIVQGALQVWLTDKVGSAALAGYLQVLAAVGELVATFLARQEQRRLRRQLERQSQLDQFNRGLHESLDLDQIAYRIANDGRVLLNCDRLCVAVRRGSQFKVLAVSGADHVHRRSESMQQLQRLCQTVVASGEPIWHCGTADEGKSREMAPQISTAISAYLDISPALSLAVVPLAAATSKGDASRSPVGVLVLEQYERPFDPASRDLVRAMGEHCRLALTNAERLASIPGHRLWLAAAREGRVSRWASRGLLAVLAIAAIATTLIAVPADVRIKARGELQPVVRHEVFAPRDGVVTTIHVDHGQTVRAGDTLLEVRSPELDLEMQRVGGELETARKRLAAAQSERLQTKTSDADARLRQRRLTAEEEQLQQQVRDLADRQTMLQRQREELTVKSPHAGEVITWNVQQQLMSRPLRRGDALITIADVAGPWQLELKVPSRRAGRLLAARRDSTEPQAVSFQLATNPGKLLDGTIHEIAPRLETDESGETYILATVDVPRDLIENRAPGATAFARIHCGRGSVAEAWFHDLLDAARLWMPF